MSIFGLIEKDMELSLVHLAVKFFHFEKHNVSKGQSIKYIGIWIIWWF